VISKILSWSLTLREELIVKVTEDSMLRRMFGPRRERESVKWEEVSGENSEELRKSYLAPNIISRPQ
jgi:hypothetical protein